MPECKSAKRDTRRRVARTRGSLGQERNTEGGRKKVAPAVAGGRWKHVSRVESEKKKGRRSERGCLWGGRERGVERLVSGDRERERER